MTQTLMISRATIIIALVTATACGGKSGSGSVDYSVSAQKNYDKGLKELESKDWVAASKITCPSVSAVLTDWIVSVSPASGSASFPSRVAHRLAVAASSLTATPSDDATGASFTGVMVSANVSDALSEPSLAITMTSIDPL